MDGKSKGRGGGGHLLAWLGLAWLHLNRYTICACFGVVSSVHFENTDLTCGIIPYHLHQWGFFLKQNAGVIRSLLFFLYFGRMFPIGVWLDEDTKPKTIKTRVTTTLKCVSKHQDSFSALMNSQKRNIGRKGHRERKICWGEVRPTWRLGPRWRVLPLMSSFEGGRYNHKKNIYK